MELCDATAAGSEKAAVMVYTRKRKFALCMHHFRPLREEFKHKGYRAMLIRPPIPGGMLDPSLSELDTLDREEQIKRNRVKLRDKLSGNTDEH